MRVGMPQLRSWVRAQAHGQTRAKHPSRVGGGGVAGRVLLKVALWPSRRGACSCQATSNLDGCDDGLNGATKPARTILPLLAFRVTGGGARARCRRRPSGVLNRTGTVDERYDPRPPMGWGTS